MTLTHEVKKLWDKVDELGLDMRELDRRITRLDEAEAENQRLQAQIAKPSDNQSLSLRSRKSLS